MERLDVVDPHNPSDSMLATGFTRFAQIEKDPRGSVHAVACVVGRDDQSKQSLIFPRSIGERISQPRIEPAARHVEETAHHGRIKLMTMGLDEGVLHSNILRSLPHMHGVLPWSNAFQMCPLNLGKSSLSHFLYLCLLAMRVIPSFKYLIVKSEFVAVTFFVSVGSVHSFSVDPD